MWNPSTRDAARRGPAPTDTRARWRTRQLQRAGFDRDLATRLAGDATMDLHALIELVERGCPPDLATRILGPIDCGRRPC